MDVYAKPDGAARVTFLALACELSEAERTAHSWQKVGSVDDEDAAQRAAVLGNRWPGPLRDEGGRWAYKLENGAMAARTEEEKAQDTPDAPAPSQLDRVEAQAVYTAMMTDTLLES